MSDVKYKAVFEMTGINVFQRGKVEREFVRLYNEYVGQTNQLIEGLNNEYEFYHPKSTGVELTGDSLDKYNRWMAKEFQKVCDKMNNDSDLLELWVDEEVVLHGRLKTNHDSDVHFYLKAY